MPRVSTKIHLDRDARDERREICNLWKNKIFQVCEEQPETFGIRNRVAPLKKAENPKKTEKPSNSPVSQNGKASNRYWR